MRQFGLKISQYGSKSSKCCTAHWRILVYHSERFFRRQRLFWMIHWVTRMYYSFHRFNIDKFRLSWLISPLLLKSSVRHTLVHLYALSITSLLFFIRKTFYLSDQINRLYQILVTAQFVRWFEEKRYICWTICTEIKICLNIFRTRKICISFQKVPKREYCDKKSVQLWSYVFC